MTVDLTARIRAKLDTIGENDDDCRMQCGRSCAEDGYDDVVAALLAVVEMHRRVNEDWTHVNETSEEFARRWALEEAVAAIADKLGIEAR